MLWNFWRKWSQMPSASRKLRPKHQRWDDGFKCSWFRPLESYEICGCFQLDDSETMRTWQMRHLKWNGQRNKQPCFIRPLRTHLFSGVSRPAICWSQELASALTTAGQHELTLSLLEAFQSGEKNRKTRGKERLVYLKILYCRGFQLKLKHANSIMLNDFER